MTNPEIERIYQLREELHTHNYNYYVLNSPVISDIEFDHMMRELQDLEAKYPETYDENSPTMRVGSDINKDFVQVEHRYPMLSLGNTYSEEEVTDFYERVRKSLNEDFEICCEMKFDGTSISLTYENGKLVLTDSERKRITGGITLSIDKPFISDIRLNYEQYFYNDGAYIKESERNKLVIEVMTRF